MRIFGLPVPFMGREKAQSLSTVGEGRGWNRIFESFSGAWQKGVEVDANRAATFHAYWTCLTLISSDIAKLPIRLVSLREDGIWQRAQSPAYSPVLRKPNPYQTRIQFIESWVLSKLQTGNTYVLKQRDGRGVVVALHVLNPRRVTVLVADDGSVFYQLNDDKLSGLGQAVTVPAREIIHDRFNTLYHPLVGIPPIFANGLAATQGLNIQQNSAAFFGNQSQPGGVLTAPNSISKEVAERLKDHWTTNFSGKNAGKIAVLGDGLKYERMALTAQEAQMIEQMKWTAEVVATTFHVPLYKIGVGQMPSVTNVQSLNVEYYSQCLQRQIEDIELCLDEGLGIGEGVVTGGVTYGVEFDVENLLRMDSLSQMQVLKEGAGIMKVDEQRAKMGLPPVKGGDTVYLQQQNYSLAALAKRDARDDPFAKSQSGNGQSQNEPDDPEPIEEPTKTLALPAPVKAIANDNLEAEATRALLAVMKGLS